MSSYFSGKNFLVTGASGGIGRSIAEALLDQGASVAVMARRKEKLEELRSARDTALQSRVLVTPGDVSSESDCNRVVDAAAKTFGSLHGIIHNAGISQRSLAAETDAKVFREIIDVDYLSAVYLYRAAFPALRSTRGHFVGISSMQGLYSTQYRSGYAAAKHALQGFLDSIRLEEHEFGVHVMSVSPGFVQTDISLNARAADGSSHGQMDDRIANGLPPEEVARQVLAGIAARKRDVFPSGRLEKIALFLSKWWPSRLDKMLLKARVT